MTILLVVATFPRLDELHFRHFGLTPAKCQALAEAAVVCLSRHHSPPTTLEVAVDSASVMSYEIEWSPATARELAAHRNEIDATEEGACSVSLAALELELGLVAVSRADTLTGADYLVSRLDNPSLEDSWRLEVSGTDRGDRADVERRVRLKIDQVTAPSSDPWIVSVVGFRAQMVRIERSQ
jgi:hypothetical protein